MIMSLIGLKAEVQNQTAGERHMLTNINRSRLAGISNP